MHCILEDSSVHVKSFCVINLFFFYTGNTYGYGIKQHIPGVWCQQCWLTFATLNVVTLRWLYDNVNHEVQTS